MNGSPGAEFPRAQPDASDARQKGGTGLELLPELHDSEGNAIPVIILSGEGANPLYAAQLQTALVKSRAPIDQLVATLRRRLAARHPIMADERVSA